MSFILFIFLLSLSAVAVLLGNHYRKLFSLSKEEFKRDEILNIKDILTAELKLLINIDGTQNEKTSYISLGIGILFGYIANHIGGIYTEYQNDYLFNSALVPALVILGLPYVKQSFFTLKGTGEQISSIPVIKDILLNDTPFIAGVSIEVMAQLIFIYGNYHSLSFMWVILNYIGTLALFLYHIYNREKESS